MPSRRGRGELEPGRDGEYGREICIQLPVTRLRTPRPSVMKSRLGDGPIVATDSLSLLARAAPHLGACSLRLWRVATDIRSREEGAGTLFLRSVAVVMISR